ncbi:hypothetical protein LP420_33050 [Massilia sp. B-10]|nr:hypothetical protein LP420_33050 [Massilia sp. B-10]
MFAVGILGWAMTAFSTRTASSCTTAWLKHPPDLAAEAGKSAQDSQLSSPAHIERILASH